MAGWLYIIGAVILGTLGWCVARWSLGNNGRPELLGLWGAPTALLVSWLVWGLSGQPLWQWPGILFGAMNGIGACVVTVLIMTCVKIGPVGPTVAVGSIGFVWPATISLLFVKSAIPNVWLVTGLVCTIAGVLLIGFKTMQVDGSSLVARTFPSHRTMTPRWLAMGLGAWVSAGLCQIAQMLNADVVPKNPGAFMVFTNVIALLIMFFICRGRGGVRWGREAIGGLALGILGNLCLILTLKALTTIGAEIVFPITAAVPILAMMIAGRVFYRESLRSIVWAAVLIILIGVTVLAYGDAVRARL